MQEIRFHGRGGQGAVIGSEVLAQAFFLEGKCAQAFPRVLRSAMRISFTFVMTTKPT